MNVLKAMRLAIQAYPEVSDAELQQAQNVLGENIWDCTEREQNARRAAYRATVATLEERNPNADVGATDPWTAESYSEVYKDDHGFRPRGHISGQRARAYLNARQVNDYFDLLRDHAEDLRGDY